MSNRQIDIDASRAFINKYPWQRSNTEVKVEVSSTGDMITELLLHGNKIAWHDSRLHDADQIIIRSCGWFTVTTKARLNALPGVNIIQRKGLWYLNGEQWDGEEKLVSTFFTFKTL